MFHFLKKKYFLLALILLLAAFFRFYQLGNVPAGLTNDEADEGYDAYSISKTGKDQWGEKFPAVNFKGFGDYRLSLYTYAITPFVKIFDLNALSVRLPSAIFGIGSVIAIYILTNKLLGNKVGLLSALMLSISPWSIGLSRVGIESNVAIFFLLVSLFYLFEFRNKKMSLYIGIFFLALTIYTYSAYLLFSFLVLLMFMVFFFKDISRMRVITSFLLFFILLLPIFSKNISSVIRFNQVGLTNNAESNGLLQDLNASRGACLKVLPDYICKLSDNKFFLFTEQFAKNYFSHFSFRLLYFEGTETQFSILYKRGLDYSFNILFLIVGVYYLFRYRNKERIFLLFLFILAPVPDSLTGPGNYSRMSIMMPFLAIIESVGLYYVIKTLASLKSKAIKYFSVSAIIFLVIYSLLSFSIKYFIYFRDNYSKYSEYGYSQMMKDLYKRKNDYDAIYISRHLNDVKQYIYYLFYNKYDPQKIQSKNKVTYNYDQGGWIEVLKVENINFVRSLSQVNYEKLSSKTLLIGHPSEFPSDIKTVGEIKDRVGLTRFKEVELLTLRKHTLLKQ